MKTAKQLIDERVKKNEGIVFGGGPPGSPADEKKVELAWTEFDKALRDMHKAADKLQKLLSDATDKSEMKKLDKMISAIEDFIIDGE